MSGSPPLVVALKRPSTIIGGLVLLVVVIVWLLAFFVPQGHKLSSLRAQEASLRQAVAQDDAKVQTLRKESQHTAQIQAMYNGLAAYVPATEDLYTYIQTLSGAGKAAGVTITNISASSLVAVAKSNYSAVPITTAVKGTYDHLLAFLHDVYGLPRLTDIDSMSISGGGPGTNRTTTLTVTFQLSIFTSEKPASPAS
jgi:Tfp pilus assembly protein PilO